MLTVVKSSIGQATAALSHFFRGLIIADGGLSTAEEGKIAILVHKMRHSLPGDNEQIVENISLFRNDPDYAGWSADRHLDEALRFLDEFSQVGTVDLEHMKAILELLEIIMEVGTVTEGERQYLARVEREFAQRFPSLLS